jgi:hypothetical protein
MNRMRRAVTVFLLALAVALPAAALPAPERTLSWGERVLSVLWAHLAPVLGISAESRASMDPDGSASDSRSGADPNG